MERVAFMSSESGDDLIVSFAIADEDYVVDVEDLRAVFGRVPEGADEDMIIDAWDCWINNPDPNHLQQLFVESDAWKQLSAVTPG